MRFRTFTALAGAATTVVLLGACESSSGSGTGTLETDEQKASYGIGLNMGQQLAASLQGADDAVDFAALTRGVRDAVEGSEPAIDQEEMQRVLQALSESVAARREEAAAAAQAEGEAFLAENGEREEVTTTESGLQYEVVEEGDGPNPEPGDQVTLHYRGTLLDGTEFDSSHGGDPAVFGVGGVIQGFSEGLQLMPVGSTYKLYIPSGLGYGPQGSGPNIGPNETLVFEVELLEIG